jgi:hypothetical protein
MSHLEKNVFGSFAFLFCGLTFSLGGILFTKKIVPKKIAWIYLFTFEKICAIDLK